MWVSKCHVHRKDYCKVVRLKLLYERLIKSNANLAGWAKIWLYSQTITLDVARGLGLPNISCDNCFLKHCNS